MKTKEQFEKIIREAEEGIRELEKESLVDFSEYIGRNGSTIAIKGEKFLKVYKNGNIFYDNILLGYNRPLSYREANLNDVKKGDVFILKGDVNGMDFESFNIVMGKDDDGDFRTHCLNKIAGIEYIDYRYISGNPEVYIFNRD